MKWLALLFIVGAAHAADPSSVPAPKVTAGSSWVYASTRSDGKTATVRTEVLRARAGEIVVNRAGTEVTYSEPWTIVRTKTGKRTVTLTPGMQTVPFPLVVGQTHLQRIDIVDEANGSKRTDAVVTAVRGWEDIVVPAGRFRVLRIDREERNGIDTSAPGRTVGTYWYAPEVRLHAQIETHDAVKDVRVTSQLQSYKVR
jgi:hypothetical protein